MINYVNLFQRIRRFECQIILVTVRKAMYLLNEHIKAKIKKKLFDFYVRFLRDRMLNIYKTKYIRILHAGKSYKDR